jgi:hypothetical protein
LSQTVPRPTHGLRNSVFRLFVGLRTAYATCLYGLRSPKLRTPLMCVLRVKRPTHGLRIGSAAGLRNSPPPYGGQAASCPAREWALRG